jgi:CubicO group peptidase (beta-lactamase class C family)
MSLSCASVTTVDALLHRVQREIDSGLLPACQVAIAKDGELVAFETFGDATNDDRFIIFSSTKAFVASAIWLLMSEGKIDISRRVSDYIPEFGANGKDAITIEQVLLHNAGFPSGFLNPFDWDDRTKRHEILASWPLEWEPGSMYRYHALSSSWVQAALIEHITDTDFRTFIHERITEPLGLKSFRLGVGVEEQSNTRDLVTTGEPVTAEELKEAWGVDEVPPTWLSQDLLLFLNDPEVRTVGIPGGGGISTAADVAMFYQGLLRSGIWDPSVIERATTTTNTMPDDLGVPTTRCLGIQACGDSGYGWWYGFGKDNSPRAFGHDGAGGQIAWVNPETGLSFCYLTNGLDRNILREKRRTLGIGSRAATLEA